MDAREQLLQAAIKVYSTSGVRGATTKRIAQEAGVNEVTLFRHFGSKDALLHEALAQSAAALFESGLPAEPRRPGDGAAGVRAQSLPARSGSTAS